jgi:predicted DCC family thiol-disulfide oxidoreductase YuxK
MVHTDARPLLLYDGACGFCASVVQFILEHDRRGTLRFASLQGTVGRAIVAASAELEGVDSVVWVERDQGAPTDRLLIRSDAALRIARYLGGHFHLLRPGWIVPRPLRDWTYDLVARHRHRLVSAETCVIPTAEQRARFVD